MYQDKYNMSIDDISSLITELEEKYLNPKSKYYMKDTKENQEERDEIIKEIGDLIIKKINLEKFSLSNNKKNDKPIAISRQRGQVCYNAEGCKKYKKKNTSKKQSKKQRKKQSKKQRKKQSKKQR